MPDTAQAAPETGAFFRRPILNSPWEPPTRHWELDGDRRPTHRALPGRRPVAFVTPIPGPKKHRSQSEIALHEKAAALADERGEYRLAELIESVRRAVAQWRALPEAQWRVTSETARLLRHWRAPRRDGFRPFFCQVEAVETAIWLAEAAPRTAAGRRFVARLDAANEDANPGLPRLALKLATGAGKTAVMAMLIAWQTVNAVRRPNSARFARGFMIVAPGIAIRDRLRVLLPNDPDNYYSALGLVPADMRGDLQRARVVVANYHVFGRRETMAVARVTKALLQGRGPELRALETEGQMLRRAARPLLDLKTVMVINDEAHHCYREKPGDPEETAPKGDDGAEAKHNREAARLWISGVEALRRAVGVNRVVDLSATHFFLRGSGYAEGTLFPWTMSDFSLMDAIECGIVKLPRVPVADDAAAVETPVFRNLWQHIGKKMPKGTRNKAADIDPIALPSELRSALDALYGHYEETFAAWQKAGAETPPCFIVVCNGTATSKLIYDCIAGFERETADGERVLQQGSLALFRNYGEDGKPLPRPRTLLIDSRQLESGETLDPAFLKIAKAEIEIFHRDYIARTGDAAGAAKLTDADLLREVVNTVGKPGRLGADIRCVVSVAMLTEGWDANTVTHILGVRAFGTQLLCEQVVGRALRRQSYDPGEDGLTEPEYADIFGIPFDFTAEPVVAPPALARKTVRVHAVSPGRDTLEIRFPRIAGYRTDLPAKRLEARFGPDSKLILDPQLVGATEVRGEGIVGEGVDFTLKHLKSTRNATVAFHLGKHLLETKWRGADDEPERPLFGQLKDIACRWLDECLECQGGTAPAQILYRSLADTACDRIHAAIVEAHAAERPVCAILDPFDPEGSTRHVRFDTSRATYATDPRRCHVNRAVLDSDWEAEFCRIAERHPRVRAWVKNHGLGLEIPYRDGSEQRRYIPDYILLIAANGAEAPLRLLVEIKGFRGENAKAKATAARSFWIPAANRLASHGRWAFAELTGLHTMQADLESALQTSFEAMLAPHPAP